MARVFTLRDLESIKKIALLTFSKRWSDSDFNYFLSSESARCYGLFGDPRSAVGLRKVTDGNLACYVLSLVAQGDLDIISIATDPAWQGKGLAYWCLKAIDLMNDIQRAYLEVDESSLKAIRLYQRAGFSQYGIRKKYYEGKRNAVLMKKDYPRVIGTGTL